MSSGARHKGDTVASLLASDEARDKVMKGSVSKRRGIKNPALVMQSLLMKQKQRDGILRSAGRPESLAAEYSETAQEIKIRKAAEKRARKSQKV
jgi:hypothetical protein